MKGKANAADYLLYDPASGKYREDPEQAVRDDVEKHYWLHVGRTILKDWRLYVMLIPMLLVFLFWRYFPMYELLASFKSTANMQTPVSEREFIGFSAFTKIIAGDMAPRFWRALRNTFLLSFYGLCFGFPMPIILALFFNEIKSNFLRSIYQVLTYLPKFVSTVIMTSIVTMLLKQGGLTFDDGILVKALHSMGVIGKEAVETGMLRNPDFFRSIYQISGIWEGAGYDSIVYFAAIIAISPTSYALCRSRQAEDFGFPQYVRLRIPLSF